MSVYKSIIEAMADIEPIAKGRRNQQQGFNFRGIDEIMNELQPILKKHGLFVVPRVVDVQRSERSTKDNKGVLLYTIATMEYTMYASDGTFITGSTVGEGMDSGDKASNKAMAVALKYFLLQTFCIPTEDAKDPDSESHSVAPQNPPKPQQTPKPHQDQKPDLTPEQLAAQVRAKVAGDKLGLTTDEKKAIAQKHGNDLFKIADYLECVVAEKKIAEACAPDEQAIIDQAARNVQKTFGGNR